MAQNPYPFASTMRSNHQKRLILSPQEVSVLAAFDQDTEASVHEIITRSQLTPSQARSGISSLVNKQMMVQQTVFLRLTPEGMQTRQRLHRKPGSVFVR